MKRLVGAIAIASMVVVGTVIAINKSSALRPSNDAPTSSIGQAADAGRSALERVGDLKAKLGDDYLLTALRLGNEGERAQDMAATLVDFVRHSDVDPWPA